MKTKKSSRYEQEFRAARARADQFKRGPVCALDLIDDDPEEFAWKVECANNREENES